MHNHHEKVTQFRGFIARKMGDEVTSKTSNAGSSVPCFSIQIGFVRDTFSIPDDVGETRSTIIKEKVYDMVRKRVSIHPNDNPTVLF